MLLRRQNTHFRGQTIYQKSYARGQAILPAAQSNRWRYQPFKQPIIQLISPIKILSGNQDSANLSLDHLPLISQKRNEIF